MGAVTDSVKGFGVTFAHMFRKVVTTKYPWAPLLADISCPNNGVIPKDYLGKSQKDFYDSPIGTGPFQFDTWQKGNFVRLKKDDDEDDDGGDGGGDR